MGQLKDELLEEEKRRNEEQDMEFQRQEEEYRFSKGNHVHQLKVKGEWRNCYGVTSVLGIIGNPGGLINWAVGLAVDAMKRGMSPEEAKKAHTKVRDKAGVHGTDVHALVERYVNSAIKGQAGLAMDVIPPEIVPFVEWCRSKGVKFLESEKSVYSKVHFYAGITDMLVEIEGKKYIADLKTGNSCQSKNWFQLGGYSVALEEMGYPKVDGYILFHLPKTGKLTVKMNYNVEKMKEVFLSALSVFKELEVLDST